MRSVVENIKPSRLLDHRSPARSRWRNSETEKRERRFRENGACHPERGLYYQRLHGVRHDMGEQDPHIACAQGACGLYKIIFPNFENLATHDACVAHPANNTQSEDYFSETRA